jgi:DNA topoisomerase-1
MEADIQTPVSQAHISKDVDRAMDKADAKFNHVPSGVAVRNGPVVEDKMDVDEPATNGNTKRKARTSTSKAPNYADSESDEDSVPLVGIFPGSASPCYQTFLPSPPAVC